MRCRGMLLLIMSAGPWWSECSFREQDAVVEEWTKALHSCLKFQLRSSARALYPFYS